MKKTLFVAISAVCLSLSASYSSDIEKTLEPTVAKPSWNIHVAGNMAIIESPEYEYDLITQAAHNTANYVKLVAGYRQYLNTHYHYDDGDPYIAKKTIDEMNIATSMMVVPSITIRGIATKETNEFYLNFTRFKGHNIATRLEDKNKLDTLFGIIKDEFNVKSIKNENIFDKDPAAKLRYQLMVLTSYSALESIGGTWAY